MFSEATRELIIAATLSVRPEYRPQLLEHLQRLHTQTHVSSAHLYEVFLQTYLFAGFPAALECVRILDRVFGLTHEVPNEDAEILAAPYKEYFEQGQVLYKKVYADKAKRVREELIRLSPELAAWSLIEGYGKTLSREGLDSITRELCIVAQLTNLGWERQLFSHILGAKNVGASLEEITGAAHIGARGNEEALAVAEHLIKKLV